jgi:hypothetical protein
MRMRVRHVGVRRVLDGTTALPPWPSSPVLPASVRTDIGRMGVHFISPLVLA